MLEEELRPLVKVTQHNIALLFCNYLQTIQVQAQVKNEDSGFVIYCQPDKHNFAQQEFEQFIAEPFHAKYQQAAWQNGDVTAVNSNSPTLLSSFKNQFFSHAGIVTLVVFTLCWLVFIASSLGWGNTVFHHLQFYPQLSFDAVLQAPHRLIGPAFFHFSWLHIVFNTMWWWQLGGSIEQVTGKFSLINLLIISALVSNVGQFFVDGPNFGGLSGVVYALVGYVWWVGWLMPDKGLSLSKPIIGFMLFWLLLGYTSLMPINVANTAHLLGLLSGCILAYIQFLKAKNT
ncbi:rhomboid family intramembrane serine protease GlpG [Cognaticolwellia beringensis]|uniref:Rhomboid family intramembrane serine protease GlpG n=1 Tax=Cognaticolwellia beringensis TaxID=1967665 RepID=A0A222G7I5_9GAMM|nr:rhomboid family intramembrane serine protease GlpG [Cognaticolwellia beringensis]ASP47573.1 rhomboid family intramembrane serine protease GlpG [Cognaticolwellia beringensis]